MFGCHVTVGMRVVGGLRLDKATLCKVMKA